MALQHAVDTTIPTRAQVLLRSDWYRRRSAALRRLGHRTHTGHRTRRV